MSRAFSRRGGRPSTVSRPSLGRMMSSAMRSVVVFPAPLPPRKPNTWPSGTAKLSPSTAIVRSNLLVTLSTSSALIAKLRHAAPRHILISWIRPRIWRTMPVQERGGKDRPTAWRATSANAGNATLRVVVLARRLDAEVIVAGFEVDFLVGADFRILVDRQVLGFEFRIGDGFLDRRGRRLEGHRLLRLQHRFGHEIGAAFDAMHRIVVGQIVKAGRALGASALGAPFGLHHEGFNSSRKALVAGYARRSAGRLAIAIWPCQSARLG